MNLSSLEDTPLIAVMRQRLTWIGSLILAYLASATYLSIELWLAVPVVIALAPLGLLAPLAILCDKCGIELPRWFETVFIYTLHFAFWSVLMIYVWRLPVLSSRLVFRIGVAIWVTILLTMTGCAGLYKSRGQRMAETGPRREAPVFAAAHLQIE